MNWTWDNAMSKGVLIFTDLNFVVKIPFNGWAKWQEDSHYEDENGNWHCWESAHKNIDELKSHYYKIMDGYEDYCEFSRADFNEESEGWDYCMVEQIRYEKAIAAGLETMFAKTEFIGRVGVMSILSTFKNVAICLRMHIALLTKKNIVKELKKIMKR